MDLKEKRELLSYYQFIRADIFIAKDEITDLRLSMIPGGMNISDMPKSPNMRDRMADYGADFDKAYRTLQKYRSWAKVITEGIIKRRVIIPKCEEECPRCHNTRVYEITTELLVLLPTD